jgi:REP element-mobilizing transposase RayT
LKRRETTVWFDPEEPVGHVRGGNLPHWRQEGNTYFVSWRTADSMPRDRVVQWLHERREWLAVHPEPHSKAEKAEYDRLFSARREQWLDESHGQCLLARPVLRELVGEALSHFDGARYRLGPNVVAPNHVHVVVTPLAEYKLSTITQNWKSYTAHAINKLARLKGTFREKESFDHVVRSAAESERIAGYILNHKIG